MSSPKLVNMAKNTPVFLILHVFAPLNGVRAYTALSWEKTLKVDVPILPCFFYTFNWLTLTSEMYFVRFHPEVTSCLLSRGKTKYAPLGMRLWCKYIRNYLLVYQLTSHFLPYLQNYKEFDGEISDLQLEKYGLSVESKKYTTSGWARGDENVIGIRAFKYYVIFLNQDDIQLQIEVPLGLSQEPLDQY